jgi:FPC/CPF motif-containing protein YcgG
MIDRWQKTDDSTEDAVRARFRSWILEPAFTCVGARSVVQRNRYRLHLYDEMGQAAATDTLAADLASFARTQDIEDPAFSTFAAAFRSPQGCDETAFEALLWHQLGELHQRDRAPWDADVSDDPANSRFAFSFAGRAFFVVGLHPLSSRLSRRFELPTLVFNARFQFERLRAQGRYGRMQAIIRARDRALQGNENPMMSDFGTRSEARQYSGRLVDEHWTCPFHPGSAHQGS